MEIKIKVEVGLNTLTASLAERLVAAMENLPRCLPAPRESPQKPKEPQATPQLPEQTPPALPPVTVTPAPQQSPTPPPSAAAAPVPPPPPERPEPESVIPDDQTLRTMMDITISRICGTNDWQQSQDPRVIDLRRSCTACFREIAAHLGGEKPTMLQGEKRNQFLSGLTDIYIDEQNRRAMWRPF